MQTIGRVLITAAALGVSAAAGAVAADGAPSPNIVFILADDYGFMDLRANNPDTLYDTPNLDRLADTGVRFTSGYAANPVCSPTRLSIMTGKYPTRHDATNWFSGRREARFRGAPLNDWMPLAEITIAEALKEAGYATAFAGKWHLGPTDEYWPEAQGFDENFGGHDRGSPPGGYFSPYRNPKLKDGPEGEHLPHRLADESIGFMRRHRDEPFFLFLSFYSVHTPLQGRDDLIAKYETRIAGLPPESEAVFEEAEQVWPDAGSRKVRVRQTHAVYGAMVEAMDAEIGRVLDALDDLGIADRTAVVFTSDNGGLSTAEGSPTSNFPLRGGKGWVYEGGIREPLLIRWPSGGASGAVCDEPVSSIDFYPTILEVAGVPKPDGQMIDGVSLAPLLREPDAELPGRDDLFWHYPHYSNQGGFPGGAIRSGDWKLVERYEDGAVHLYNLADDIGERNDVAADEPERVADMRARLHDWYREVGAKFLLPKDGSSDMPWRP